MNTFMSINQFIKMIDSGKLSPKLGTQNVYIEIKSDKENKQTKSNKSLMSKYFNKKNIPNKYNISFICLEE
jgi:hypothetical protein